ncbi:MAG: uracil-DNA glycosylase [Bryobacteraceae bacterium]
MSSLIIDLAVLQKTIANCNMCPRLREHCESVAKVKRRAYLDWHYWGKPVPGFGDPQATLLIIGLAPGAHGANRTGRVFTGDSSGDLLYRVLYATGYASQPDSRSADDGLTLQDAYIASSVRCAPPDNKPTREEVEVCRTYLEAEIALLSNVQVIVSLGKLAFDNYLTILRRRDLIHSISQFQFAHNRVHRPVPSGPSLIASFHPSQQNTSTGRLTEAMLYEVFVTARRLTK